MVSRAGTLTPGRCLLLKLPREIRDLIGLALIADKRRFSICEMTKQESVTARTRRKSTVPITLCAEMISFSKTCRQLRDEATILARRVAFLPSSVIKARVYNLDFHSAIAFVKCMQPDEIDRANRHGILDIDLVTFNANAARQQSSRSLIHWAALCDKIGLRVRYHAHWTVFSFPPHIRLMMCWREGMKIVETLDSRCIGMRKTRWLGMPETEQ